MKNRFSAMSAVATLLILAAQPALAYVGPGAGLSALGSIVAFLGVVLLMIVGFVWYPVKRLTASMRGKPTTKITKPQDQ